VVFSFTISLIFKVRASLVWFFTISACERISCDLDCAPSLILYLVTVDLSRVTIFADFLFSNFISFFFSVSHQPGSSQSLHANGSVGTRALETSSIFATEWELCL
jgi:hypothetical protein